jgi:hypothetical protein
MSIPTYKLIASQIVGSTPVTTITFSSIPATYTDLVIKASIRSNRSGVNSDGLYMSLNGNSGTNFISLENINSSATSHQTSNYGGGWVATFDGNTAASNVFSNTEIYIPNYTSSVAKSYSTDSAAEDTTSSQFANSLAAGLNTTTTSAVTSISFSANGSFVQYSTFYLYGIKNS